MRDLNFFEPYIEKTEFKIDKKLIYFTILSFVFLSLLAYMIYNVVLISQETKMVESLRATAEDPRRIKKVEEIKEKEIEVKDFKESVEKIRQLDKTIEENDIIDEAFLDGITSKMPEDLFLTSLSIQKNEVYIVGISKDKWSIAELEKGLEDLEIHEDIFVSNISLQDNHYNFSINILLKGVKEDGQ